MKYSPPKIINTVDIYLENDLLTGSVVEKETEVESTGQEIVNHDMSGFTQEWY